MPYSSEPTQVRPTPFMPPSGPQPNPLPPSQRGGAKVWAWAGAAAALVVVVVAVIAIAVGSGSDGSSEASSAATTTTTVARLVAPGALDGLLLNANSINQAMGATGMASSAGHHPITDNRFTVTPTECRVVYTVEAATYKGSAWTESVEEQVSENPSHHWVDQAVARFPSAATAASFVRDLAPRWFACANRGFTVTKQSGETKEWTAGPVSNTNGTLSVVVSDSSWRCQQAMLAANNVVVDVQACYAKLTDEGVSIANQIAARVPR